jgi:hypothetical protein
MSIAKLVQGQTGTANTVQDLHRCCDCGPWDLAIVSNDLCGRLSLAGWYCCIKRPHSGRYSIDFISLHAVLRGGVTRPAYCYRGLQLNGLFVRS